jgi:hypothetical protein
MSKGSKQRPTDKVRFDEAWDKIFGKNSESSWTEDENYQLEKAEKEYYQTEKAINELN